MDQSVQTTGDCDDQACRRFSADTLILGTMTLGGLMAFAALLISVSGITR